MSFVTADGITLHFRIDGDEGLPLLVLSNGLGTELSMWDTQIPVLARAFRVMRYDTRGHGASSTPSESFRIEDLGRDVLALLAAHARLEPRRLARENEPPRHGGGLSAGTVL